MQSVWTVTSSIHPNHINVVCSILIMHACIFMNQMTCCVYIQSIYIVFMSKHPVPFVFFNCKPQGFTTWRRGAGGRSPPKDDQRIIADPFVKSITWTMQSPTLGQTSKDFQSFFHCTSFISAGHAAAKASMWKVGSLSCHRSPKLFLKIFQDSEILSLAEYL